MISATIWVSDNIGLHWAWTLVQFSDFNTLQCLEYLYQASKLLPELNSTVRPKKKIQLKQNKLSVQVLKDNIKHFKQLNRVMYLLLATTLKVLENWVVAQLQRPPLLSFTQNWKQLNQYQTIFNVYWNKMQWMCILIWSVITVEWRKYVCSKGYVVYHHIDRKCTTSVLRNFWWAQFQPKHAQKYSVISCFALYLFLFFWPNKSPYS